MQANLRKFVAEWILPEEQPAPKGEKLILLTAAGTADRHPVLVQYDDTRILAECTVHLRALAKWKVSTQA